MFIIWWLNSLFCDHIWSYEEVIFSIRDEFGDITRSGPKVSATCDKCGWHRSYWKY